MIVCITGGTGFIGRRLVLRHLSKGDSVRVLSRRRDAEMPRVQALSIYHGDLTEKNSFSLHKFLDGAEILYHCAGELRDRARMVDTHVHGTQQLLNAAKGRIRHWVQLSSVGVYGPRSEGVVTEETPWQPQGEYETTKAESDRLVINQASSQGFSYSILRPSNVFGPGMPNRSLYQMIEMIGKGFFFFIGPPGAAANYIPVDNVVEALILCARLPAANERVFNVSAYLSLEEFIATITKAMQKRPPKLRLPELPIRIAARVAGRLPGWPLTESRVDALVNRAIYSTERIERELGYAPKITVEEGMRQLIDSLRS